MCPGSLPSLSPSRRAGSNRRFCVLSTGQKYYFFRIDKTDHKPRVTFLGLCRFRYFPPTSTNTLAPAAGEGGEDEDHEDADTAPNRLSDLGRKTYFPEKAFALVVAAFLVCILDRNDADLESLLEKAQQKFEILSVLPRDS